MLNSTNIDDREIWKPLNCFPHPYEVSNTGRVKSLPYTYEYVRKDTGKKYRRKTSSKILKPVKSKYGIEVYIFTGNDWENLPVWLLLCGAFYNVDISSRFKPQIRFKDGDMYNVTLDNIELVKDLAEEIWKDIEGYEGYYQVSNLGRIKRLERIGKSDKHMGDRILSLNQPKSPYLIVRLAVESDNFFKDKNFTVHKLVASAFLPKIEGKNEVNHIDGNKKNNCASNLEWVSRSENMKHAYETGLASANITTAITCQVYPEGLTFESIKAASEYIGCSAGYAQERLKDGKAIFNKYTIRPV